MSTLTGILLDVSDSMSQSVGGGMDQPSETAWVMSIFKVLDGLLQHDVSDTNVVFAIGVGAKTSPYVFDILTLLENPPLGEIDSLEMDPTEMNSTHQVQSTMQQEELLNEILSFLEDEGAPYVRKWAIWSVLCQLVDRRKASILLDALQTRPSFVREFVAILPEACKQRVSISTEIGFSLLGGFDTIIGAKEDGSQASLVKGQMKDVIEKGMHMVKDQSKKGMHKEITQQYMLKHVTESSVKHVHDVAENIRGSIHDGKITQEQSHQLLEYIEPYIYGGTPLIEAMERSRELFALARYRNHKKILFVLSDGQPTDGDDPPLEEFSDLDVTIISCYITDRHLDNPRQLFSKIDAGWDYPAKFMFKMSTTMMTQQLPCTILVNKGWQVQTDNNETKLFIQANHPDILDEAIEFAQNIVCGQDALVDALATVSLDLYINKTCDDFEPKDQGSDKTCYANAAAAVMHLAMNRIIGRSGGYPDFIQLRDEMVAKYGLDGAIVPTLLSHFCPRYRLQYREVGLYEAVKAVAAKRTVLVTFRLSRVKWELFFEFYDAQPTGILTKADLEKRSNCRNPRSTPAKHAVVLTSFNKDGLTLMNSWGDDWANKGFFRIQNADVLNLTFYDIYWTLDDLSNDEKKAFERHGKQKMREGFDKLKGLKNAKYRCPLCYQESKVSEFSGHLLNATCPECGEEFNVHEAGDDLALNMYLTAMSA